MDRSCKTKGRSVERYAERQTRGGDKTIVNQRLGQCAHKSNNVALETGTSTGNAVNREVVEPRSTSHQNTSYQGQDFTGQMTQPTVSKH